MGEKTNDRAKYKDSPGAPVTVGEFSFEIVKKQTGIVLEIRVVGSSRGCGFDIEATTAELKQLANYLERSNATGWRYNSTRKQEGDRDLTSDEVYLCFGCRGRAHTILDGYPICSECLCVEGCGRWASLKNPACDECASETQKPFRVADEMARWGRMNDNGKQKKTAQRA